MNQDQLEIETGEDPPAGMIDKKISLGSVLTLVSMVVLAAVSWGAFSASFSDLKQDFTAHHNGEHLETMTRRHEMDLKLANLANATTNLNNEIKRLNNLLENCKDCDFRPPRIPYRLPEEQPR